MLKSKNVIFVGTHKEVKKMDREYDDEEDLDED